MAEGVFLGKGVSEGEEKVFFRERWTGDWRPCCSHCVVYLCVLESEVAGAGVAVVVELLLDVDHVAAGVLQLSELGPATEVSEVAELGQPRPRRGVWRNRSRSNRVGINDATWLVSFPSKDDANP